MLKTRIMASSTAVVLAGAVALVPGATAASAAPATSGVTTGARSAAPAAQAAATSVPVTGTLADGSAFAGSLSDLSVKRVGGALALTGTITGTGLPAGGTTFSAPIQDLAVPAGCSILNLDLGPLDLNLLGLVVNLAPVSLDITAVPGAGNLLGNLLCAVAHLLDGAGNPLGGLVALLNRLLTGLGL